MVFSYVKQKRLAFTQEEEATPSVKKEYQKNVVFSSILEMLICSPEDVY